MHYAARHDLSISGWDEENSIGPISLSPISNGLNLLWLSINQCLLYEDWSNQNVEINFIYCQIIPIRVAWMDLTFTITMMMVHVFLIETILDPEKIDLNEVSQRSLFTHRFRSGFDLIMWQMNNGYMYLHLHDRCKWMQYNQSSQRYTVMTDTTGIYTFRFYNIFCYISISF